MIVCGKCGRDTLAQDVDVGGTTIAQRLCTGCMMPSDVCSCDPTPGEIVARLLVDHGKVLTDIKAEMTALREHMTRPQKAPGTFDLPFLSSLRLRTYYIVIATTAAADVVLQIGERLALTYTFPGADTRTYPLRVVIGRGLEVSLVPSAGSASGYLIADYD